jgi:hypothetical protein
MRGLAWDHRRGWTAVPRGIRKGQAHIMRQAPEGQTIPTRAGTPGGGDHHEHERGPRGIGTGVAFDWALAVQLLTDAGLAAFGVLPTTGRQMSAGARPPLVAGLLVAAALVAAQGEALRRGRRVAWLLQVAFNTLLVLDGLAELPRTITALQVGHVGQLLREVVLLVVSPLLVWLLTRPDTRTWVKTTTASAASARHGGRWIVWIAGCAVIGGVAIAFASKY